MLKKRLLDDLIILFIFLRTLAEASSKTLLHLSNVQQKNVANHPPKTNISNVYYLMAWKELTLKDLFDALRTMGWVSKKMMDIWNFYKPLKIKK